jgi:trk system potassium uptake protein
MNVIIVGCGRLGAELAYRLYKRGMNVAVIDQFISAFNKLPLDFRGKTCEGEALHQDVLRRAGIETADAMAVLTSSDALNAVVSHVARSIYHIPHVIVRAYNPQCQSLYETFSLQSINAMNWGAQRIEEMIAHSDARAIFSAGNGEVEIYEIPIHSDWHGKSVKDLITSKRCLLVSLTHAGKAFLPTPETVLQEGDILHISATLDGLVDIKGLVRFEGKGG